MCKCTPEIRTPYCGKLSCQWPKKEGIRINTIFPKKDSLPLELQNLSMEIYRKEQDISKFLNDFRNSVIDECKDYYESTQYTQELIDKGDIIIDEKEIYEIIDIQGFDINDTCGDGSERLVNLISQSDRIIKLRY